MTAEQWQPKNATTALEFIAREGFPQGLMELKSGAALLKDRVFCDGTIGLDFKPISPSSSSSISRATTFTLTTGPGLRVEPHRLHVARRRFGVDDLFGTALRQDLIYPDGYVIPNGDHIPSYNQIHLGVSHAFGRLSTGPLTARFDYQF
jgi:hypothetical protein